MTSITSLPNARSGLAVPAAAPETPLDETGPAIASPVTPADSRPDAPLPAAPLSHEELQKIVAQTNEVLAATTQQLHFSVDKETGAYVIKLMDQQTGKTLYQFPSEKMLGIARAIMDLDGGSLVDHEV